MTSRRYLVCRAPTRSGGPHIGWGPGPAAPERVDQTEALAENGTPRPQWRRCLRRRADSWVTTRRKKNFRMSGRRFEGPVKARNPPLPLVLDLMQTLLVSARLSHEFTTILRHANGATRWMAPPDA